MSKDRIIDLFFIALSAAVFAYAFLLWVTE
jgi:hypothetical protein